jgi:hypothetical protein
MTWLFIARFTCQVILIVFAMGLVLAAGLTGRIARVIRWLPKDEAKPVVVAGASVVVQVGNISEGCAGTCEDDEAPEIDAPRDGLLLSVDHPYLNKLVVMIELAAILSDLSVLRRCIELRRLVLWLIKEARGNSGLIDGGIYRRQTCL